MSDLDQSDAAWQRRVEHCLEVIEEWEKRLLDPPVPNPVSRLARDDALHASFPASLIAWSSIAAAVDHLATAADSIRREGGARMHPTGFAPICRSALVAASQAIWVMTGGRDVRLRRVRLIELEERRQYREFVRDYANDPGLAQDVDDAMLGEMSEVMQKLDDRIKELRLMLKPSAQGEYSVTRTLKDAAAEIEGGSGQDRWLLRAYLFEWRMASGDAHARLWPTSVRPHEDIPLVGQGSSLRISTGSVVAYGQALGAATMAVEHAFVLWDRHTSPPEGHVNAVFRGSP